jgi:hypothetical protein
MDDLPNGDEVFGLHIRIADPLKAGQARNVGALVGRARGDHDGPRRDLRATRKRERQALATALKPLHAYRDGHLGSKFKRLVECPTGQRLPRDAGRKAQIILDPRRSAGLTAHGTVIENDRREAFRSAVDGCRQSGWTCADDGDVVDLPRIYFGDDAEGGSQLLLIRPLQQTAVGAYDQRQIDWQKRHALNEAATLAIDFGIHDEVGIAVPGQKALEAQKIGIVWRADEDRPGAAVLDQPDATQNERAHDDLTDFRRPDHQRPQMRRVDRKQGRAILAGSSRGDRRAAVDLADFARELPCTVGCDRRLVVRTVPPQDVDRAVEHEPNRHVAVPRGPDHVARRKMLWRAAGEAARRFDLDL